MSNNIFNPDIYEMSEVLHDMGKKFMPEEDEETLALGSYGYWNAIHSQIISNNIRIAQENSNEMFYNKAKLPKNVLAYAIENDIEDINAVPAKMPIQLWIIEDDLENLILEHDPTNKRSMVLDTMLPFFIGDYEYHLDYNLIITRRESVTGSIYSGKYDMSVPNPISDIEVPYIDTPYRMRHNNKNYICFSLDLHQVYKTKIVNTLISNNVIENKSFMFSFEHQLADFSISVTENGETTQLKPIFSGAPLNGEKNYCNYTYIDDSNIRVLFDGDSYMPSINATVVNIVQTTDGEAGNIEFLTNFVTMLKDTDDYTYLSSQVAIFPQGRSEGGKDKKTTEELQRLLPQEALSRGNLVNNADLNNYFNKYNTDSSKIVFQKKIHNQIDRRYYSYYLHKDSANNVVPTNTIDLTIRISDLFDPDNKYITRNYEYSGDVVSNVVFTFETGSYIGLLKLIATDDDGNYKIVSQDETTDEVEYAYNDKAEFIVNPDQSMMERTSLITNFLDTHYPNISEEKRSALRNNIKGLTVQEFYDKYGFLYTFPYRTSINSTGPYSSFYMTIMDEIYRINYIEGNNESPLEMILTYGSWFRAYKGDGVYQFFINITQSLDSDFNLIKELEEAIMMNPSYTVIEVTDDVYGNQVSRSTTVRDLTDAIIIAKLSTANMVTVFDNNNLEAGNIYTTDESIKYYINGNKPDSTETIKYDTETEPEDKFADYLSDTEYAYIKILDSNGNYYRLLDTSVEELPIDGEDISATENLFTANKTYIVAHANTINGIITTEEYTSLVDALNASLKKYYTSAPVVNYTITEKINDTDTTNLLYNSAEDFSNNDLCFLQIKSPEGIINIRSTVTSVLQQIAKIPKDFGYEHQVFDKYGYIEAPYSNYTQNWENSQTSQSEGVVIIDDFSTYDTDPEQLYDSRDILSNFIYHKFKIVFYNKLTGEATTCKYVDTLKAAIKYMIKAKTHCSLYYATSRDVSETVFTIREQDLIYEYNYDQNPDPIVRFVIFGYNKEFGFEDNTYGVECAPVIFCKEYASEDELPEEDTLQGFIETVSEEDIMLNKAYNINTKEELIELINAVISEEDNKGYTIANYYQFTSSPLKTSASNNNEKYYEAEWDIEFNDQQRSYITQFNYKGEEVNSSSYTSLQEILKLYGEGILSHNKLIKSEPDATGVVLYDGLLNKEKYYLEWINDNQESNCYVIPTRSILASVYQRVVNTISELIIEKTLNNSDDYNYYINVYDQYGNTVDPLKTYEGSDIDNSITNKYYMVWCDLTIGYAEDVTDSNSYQYRKVTNIEDLLQYIVDITAQYDWFCVFDHEHQYVFSKTDYPPCNSDGNIDLYFLLIKNDVGNKVFIFSDKDAYETSYLKYNFEYASCTTKITQSYHATIKEDGYELELLHAKDLSANKDNTYVDTSKITDAINLGLVVIVSEYTSETYEEATDEEIQALMNTYYKD